MAKLSAELQKYFLTDIDGDTLSSVAPVDSSLVDSPIDTTGESFSSGTISSPRSSEVTLNEILEIAGERTFGFLFVLLSLPSALPIPAPGYSTPFGIVMFLLAAQLIVGREQLWLPEIGRAHV